ncbi:MAG: HAMP domain-containing sensor histidine kinase, partial [Candidatus Cloacimonadaceae bacterium]|nr:HAMP domain-containing sensor histidine kinase [Candidatus Cloacimonadaceae bacterium]
YESSQSAYALLENLLEWARIQIGNTQFKPETIRLKAFLEKTTTLAKTAMAVKDISLHLDCPQDIAIHADVKMLQTIINNLVSNAVKFTPQGGSISIKASQDEDIRIIISDSGVGMSPEYLENLFQVDKINSRTGTNNEQGTGLGLILCKELTEIHGGSIKVESNQNEGTSFVLRFPLHKEEVKDV